MLISLFSFLFLLDIIIALDLSSLKLILLFLDQAVTLLISMFEIFSAALIDPFLIASIKSSANATALVLFVCMYVCMQVTKFIKQIGWNFAQGENSNINLRDSIIRKDGICCRN